MTALVVRGDALHLPLRDNSVDLIITSPPYFALRAYGTGHEMEIGGEATPMQFLEHLWAATAEFIRVLKPQGSIFVNLGDKYATRYSSQRGRGRMGLNGDDDTRDRSGQNHSGMGEKSLMGLPWRYAIGCIDQLGLILRAELIWSKPNGLPESVTDRVRRSHETWFHFTREPRYFAALDELREPHTMRPQRRPNGHKERQKLGVLPAQTYSTSAREDLSVDGDPRGKLPGSVWSIPSEPLRLPPWIDTAHYAAFPTEWPRRLILGFTPHQVCGVCKVGRFPIVDRGQVDPDLLERRQHRSARADDGVRGVSQSSGLRVNVKGGEWPPATILGYACACTPYTDHPGTGEPSGPKGSTIEGIRPLRFGSDPAHNLSARPKVGPWREYHLDRWTPPPGHPAIVLDPFSGTGTVCHVARALGRIGVGVDLSMAYCKLASDETLARQRAAKVTGRVHAERQGTLL